MRAGDRHCMHLEINIQGTPLTYLFLLNFFLFSSLSSFSSFIYSIYNFSYTAGDHVGIFPMNDLQEVEKLGQRLGIKNMDTLFTMTAIDRIIYFLIYLFYTSYFICLIFIDFHFLFSICTKKTSFPCSMFLSYRIDPLLRYSMHS